MDHKKFLQWAVHVRTSHKLTQKAFAARIGVNRSYVSQVESGRQRPVTSYVVAVVLAFDMDANRALVDSGFREDVPPAAC